MYQINGSRAAHNLAFRSNFCQLLHDHRSLLYKMDFGFRHPVRLSFSFSSSPLFFFFCGWRRIFIRGMKLNGIRIEGRELSRVSRDFDSLMDRLVCTGLATVYWILITILFSCQTLWNFDDSFTDLFHYFYN